MVAVVWLLKATRIPHIHSFLSGEVFMHFIQHQDHCRIVMIRTDDAHAPEVTYNYFEIKFFQHECKQVLLSIIQSWLMFLLHLLQAKSQV